MAYQPREYMYKSSWPTCSPKYIDIKTLEFHHIHSIWLLVVTLPTSERSIKSQRIKMFRQGNISIIHTCKIWGKKGVSRESLVHNNLKHIPHVMHLNLMQLQAFVKLFNGNRSHNLSPASQKQVTREHSDFGSTQQGTWGSWVRAPAQGVDKVIGRTLPPIRLLSASSRVRYHSCHSLINQKCNPARASHNPLRRDQRSSYIIANQYWWHAPY